MSFKPLQALQIFTDSDLAGLLYDEIMELLESPELLHRGFILDLGRFQSNLLLLKRELISRFSDFDPESSRSGEGQLFPFVCAIDRFFSLILLMSR